MSYGLKGLTHRFFAANRIFWRKHFGVLPLRESVAPLNRWFMSPLGQEVLAQEQLLIDEQLRNLFGYHLLQLSITNNQDLMAASRISHRFGLHPHAPEGTTVTGIADFNHLPLSADSVDAVILHHVLDYSQSPHHALREAASLLISSGHLIVVGFNPWSLFGVGRWFARLFSSAPQWRHQSLRLGRVIDWLTVLDLKPVNIQQGFYRPACKNPNTLKYLRWMDRWGKNLHLPWGGFYLIVARKDYVAVTPLKPEWQSYAGLRGWGVTKILGRANRHTRGQPKP